MTFGGEAVTIPQGGDNGAEIVMKRQRDRIAELSRASRERAAVLVEMVEHIHETDGHQAPTWASCNRSYCRLAQGTCPAHAQDAREDENYED